MCTVFTFVFNWLQFIEDTFGHAMLADCKEHGKDAHIKYKAYVLDDGLHSPMVFILLCFQHSLHSIDMYNAAQLV
jgi:hypothetical protein